MLRDHSEGEAPRFHTEIIDGGPEHKMRLVVEFSFNETNSVSPPFNLGTGTSGPLTAEQSKVVKHDSKEHSADSLVSNNWTIFQSTGCQGKHL